MNKYKYVIYKYNCVRYILYECLSEEYEEFLNSITQLEFYRSLVRQQHLRMLI